MGKYNCVRLHTHLSGHQFGLLGTKAASEKGCAWCQLIIDLVEAYKPGWTTKDLKRKFVKWRESEWELLEGRKHVGSFSIECKAKGLSIWLSFVGLNVTVVIAAYLCIDGTTTDPIIHHLEHIRTPPEASIEGQLINGSTVVPDSASQAAFDRARHWLSYCVEQHEDCGPTEDSTGPRRLIYVGEADRSMVRLVDFQTQDESMNVSDRATTPPKPDLMEAPESRSQPRTDGGSYSSVPLALTKPLKYACLSYRWGDDTAGVLTTTRDNILEHYREIRVPNLPKTIADAITVCRELEIHFLWVDSLCIIQGDEEDFAAEGARMDVIYANSYLTIYAKEPSSCKDGFFGAQAYGSEVGQWQPSVQSPGGWELFASTPRSKTKPHEPKGSVLDTRGWCFQESILPKRQLMYCGSEMIWKCREMHFCECGHFRKRRRVFSTGRGSIPTQGELKYMSGEDYHELWVEMVQDYSGRFLTKPTDKLAAIAGIARRLLILAHETNRITQDEYYAGLWGSHLLEQLHWKVVSPETARDLPGRRLHNDVPTWSWASIEGPIDYISDISWRSGQRAQVRGVVCRPLHRHNPMGPLEPGSYLDLTAPMVPLHLAVLDEALWPEYIVYGSDETFARVKLDVDVETSLLYRDCRWRKCQPDNKTTENDTRTERCHIAGCSCQYKVSRKQYFGCQLYTNDGRVEEMQRLDKLEEKNPGATFAVSRARDPAQTFLLLEPTLNGESYRRVGIGYSDYLSYSTSGSEWLLFKNACEQDIRIV